VSAETPTGFEPAPPPAIPEPVRRAAVGDSAYDELALPGPLGETPNMRDARRLGAQLPEGYVPESGAAMAFDPRIAYELALGVDTAGNIMRKYGYTLEAARALFAVPGFIATVTKYRNEITEQGVSFRLKAKIQAEDLLSHSYVLATDPEVPASVRADMIKWTARMAGLEPSEKDKAGSGGGGAGSGFTLNITFSGGGETPGPGRVIDVTPGRIADGGA